MKPVLLLFGHSFSSYTMLAALGFLAAGIYVALTNRGGRAGRLPSAQLAHIGLVGMLGGIVGAKLLYLLVMLPSAIAHFAFFRQNPALLAGYLFGGMVFYGGLLGGLLAGVLYCRSQRLPVGTAAGIFTPAIPLFHTFGRVGCVLAGCCHGVAYTGRFAVYTPAYHGTVFPIQLVEAGGNLALFLLLAAFSRRMRRKSNVLPLYLLLYSTMRFVLEFWRGDRVRGGWLLSTSQWIALALISVTVAYFVGVAWRRRYFFSKRHGSTG